MSADHTHAIHMFKFACQCGNKCKLSDILYMYSIATAVFFMSPILE